MEIKIEVNRKDYENLIGAIDDKIYDLDETIGRFFQYAEESEDVAYKKQIHKLNAQLDEKRTEYKTLRSRLMRAGRKPAETHEKVRISSLYGKIGMYPKHEEKLDER